MLEVQLVDAWPAPALITSSRIRSSERQMMERILSTACGFDCADQFEEGWIEDDGG
jgi:hypothetical protein